MNQFRVWLFLSSFMGLCAFGAAAQQPVPAAAEQLLALGNQSRGEEGAGPLKWDRALAEAAMRHCQLMVQEGAISHRFGGEPDLLERTSTAGAHFSLIEENVAVGPYPGSIHDGWMHSPGHRKNLLNPDVDRVGIAVISARGVMYAVADYARGVQVLTQPQVESAIARLVQANGVAVRRDPHDARLACMADHGFPAGMTAEQPGFVMRWQGAELDHLPQDLVNRLGSGKYQSADIGSCPAKADAGGFTAYRLAVLLY